MAQKGGMFVLTPCNSVNWPVLGEVKSGSWHKLGEKKHVLKKKK